jgi:hypothetical protein
MSTWWLVLISRSSSDSATTGLGNSGYQSLGGAVAGQDQWLGRDRAVGDEIVEVVALGGDVLSHGEVVDDEDQGPGVFAHALADGAIGVSTG